MTVLQIGDLNRTEAFYRRLGFSMLGKWGDPPGVGIGQRGDVTLMFQVADNPVNAGGRWSAYIYVEDVDAVNKEFVDEGIEVTGPPQDQYYGCRDFAVYDPDGHCLAFGTDLNPKPYGNGLGPDRGRG